MPTTNLSAEPQKFFLELKVFTKLSELLTYTLDCQMLVVLLKMLIMRAQIQLFSI